MSYRTVEIELTIKVIAKVDEGVEIQQVVDELDYNISDTTGSATIEDTEITNHEVKDSR